MKGNLYTSYTGLQQFFNDVLDFSVSRGSMENTVKRVSAALAVPYKELAGQIPREEILHIDETGWKDRTVKYWVWVFCTRLVAFFTVDKSRGNQVLKRILGETFDGAIISDFFGAYIKYANPKQQFCLAHLIRDIKFLSALPCKTTRTFGDQLLEYLKTVLQTCRQQGRSSWRGIHQASRAHYCKEPTPSLLPISF